jgi:hypothetical protein
VDARVNDEFIQEIAPAMVAARALGQHSVATIHTIVEVWES